jgi:Tfp pilus assembly major pilin PilA
VRRQRGFTLAELMVATGVAFVLGWLLLRLVATTLLASGHVGARLNASSSADRLAERLESDASSAWSVFVPEMDVGGAANADGHELDFVSEDASHRQYWWAYAFDARSQSVTAYAYAPGTAPAAGQQFDGVTALQAKVFAVTALPDPSSAIYDPLFAGAAATPVDFDFGWNNAQARGGNRFVRVTFSGTGVDRELLLSSGTAPSHFTVVLRYTPAPNSSP